VWERVKTHGIANLVSFLPPSDSHNGLHQKDTNENTEKKEHIVQEDRKKKKEEHIVQEAMECSKDDGIWAVILLDMSAWDLEGAFR
jgi:hypothetical protein